MDSNRLTKVSKYLSYVLRHNPDAIGLALDNDGWAEIDLLVSSMQGQFPDFNAKVLHDIVRTDDKRRYAISGSKIRAQQGHSIDVRNVGLMQSPPKFLYHGTTNKNWTAIQAGGSILPMNRQHVHLSTDRQTATLVASRRRNTQHIVLLIRAAEMQERGHEFFLSGNDVWLTDCVPTEFVKVVNEGDAS